MIAEYLQTRYPGGPPRRVAVREFVQAVCQRYVDRGLADANFIQELCSGDEARYWQRLSESLLAHECVEVGLTLQPSRDGPDFLVLHDGRKIWIEVICPEPTGIPQEWIERSTGEVRVVTFPHEAVLLRWTAAIKEKAEKLLGNPSTRRTGYIEKGVVGPDDAYVIAVNGPRLRHPAFASITGISQYPSAVEAVFALGPYAVQFDTRTFKTTGSGHQHRPVIKKPKGQPVPADTFFDKRFERISAILAADIDDTSVIGNAKPMALIHNPNATVPVAPGLLPGEWDFVASPNGPDEYLLERRSGRLSRS
jgi:type I restriction enzyme S subunit